MSGNSGSFGRAMTKYMIQKKVPPKEQTTIGVTYWAFNWLPRLDEYKFARRRLVKYLLCEFSFRAKQHIFIHPLPENASIELCMEYAKLYKPFMKRIEDVNHNDDELTYDDITILVQENDVTIGNDVNNLSDRREQMMLVVAIKQNFYKVRHKKHLTNNRKRPNPASNSAQLDIPLITLQRPSTSNGSKVTSNHQPMPNVCTQESQGEEVSTLLS